MKKSTLLATTIFSILAANTASAEVSLSGDIQLGIVDKVETAMDGSTFEFGFSAEEDMGNGLTGFMNVLFVHDRADEFADGSSNEESYVGVKGGFGAVTLGTQPDAAGFACGGTDIFNYNGGSACGVGAANDSVENLVAYSNTISGFSFVVAATIDGSNTGGNIGVPAGDHTLFAASYTTGPFQVGAQVTSPDSDLNIDDLTVIGATYTINDIVIGFTLGDNGTDDASAIAVTVPLGGGSLVAAYDSGDAVDDETNIGYMMSLSDNMYAGIEFTSYDVDPDDFMGVYLGMTF